MSEIAVIDDLFTASVLLRCFSQDGSRVRVLWDPEWVPGTDILKIAVIVNAGLPFCYLTVEVYQALLDEQLISPNILATGDRRLHDYQPPPLTTRQRALADRPLRDED